MVSGNIVAMALPVAMIPIYTRLYSPEEYSGWGIFSSFILIFGIIQGLSSDLIIVQFSEDKKVKEFFVSGALWLCLIYFFINLILFFGKNVLGIFIISYFEVLLVALALLFVGLLSLTRGYFNYFRKYNVIARSIVLVSVSQAILRVVMPNLPYKIYSINLLFFSYVLANLVGVSYLIANVKIPKFHFSLSTFFAGLKSFSGLAIFQTLSKLFELGSLHMVLLMLTGIYSPVEIGYYTMSLQLALLPAALIGSAFGSVLYKELIVVKERDNNLSSVNLLIKLSFALAIIYGVLFLFGLDKLVVYILGNDWGDSLATLRVLVGMSIPVIISQPLNYIFKAKDKMRLKFLLNILLFIVPISILYYSSLIALDYSTAIKYYGIGMSLCSTLILVSAIQILGMLRDFAMYSMLAIQLIVSLWLLL